MKLVHANAILILIIASGCSFVSSVKEHSIRDWFDWRRHDWFTTVVTYEGELRCPISNIWCFKFSYYEDSYVPLSSLFRNPVLLTHPFICTDRRQSGLSLSVHFTHPILEVDGYYDPYVVIHHNCSMHGDTYKHTTILPKVQRHENFVTYRYRLYINDDGERLDDTFEADKPHPFSDPVDPWYKGNPVVARFQAFLKDIPW